MLGHGQHAKVKKKRGKKTRMKKKISHLPSLQPTLPYGTMTNHRTGTWVCRQPTGKGLELVHDRLEVGLGFVDNRLEGYPSLSTTDSRGTRACHWEAGGQKKTRTRACHWEAGAKRKQGLRPVIGKLEPNIHTTWVGHWEARAKRKP